VNGDDDGVSGGRQRQEAVDRHGTRPRQREELPYCRPCRAGEPFRRVMKLDDERQRTDGERPQVMDTDVLFGFANLEEPGGEKLFAYAFGIVDENVDVGERPQDGVRETSCDLRSLHDEERGFRGSLEPREEGLEREVRRNSRGFEACEHGRNIATGTSIPPDSVHLETVGDQVVRTRRSIDERVHSLPQVVPATAHGYRASSTWPFRPGNGPTSRPSSSTQAWASLSRGDAGRPITSSAGSPCRRSRR
jgi:hypothetical protein